MSAGRSWTGSSRSSTTANCSREISRRWLTVRDTYAVNVVRDDADPPLLIAVAVCVIRLAEREHGDD